MTRRGLRFGVQWIAENDEPDCLDVTEVESFISTMLLADLFGKTSREVAVAVVSKRAGTRVAEAFASASLA